MLLGVRIGLIPNSGSQRNGFPALRTWTRARLNSKGGTQKAACGRCGALWGRQAAACWCCVTLSPSLESPAKLEIGRPASTWKLTMSKKIPLPGEPEYIWQELRDRAMRGLNYAGMLFVIFGTFGSVTFCFLQLGLVGYFFAHFFVFYLPTFWIQFFYCEGRVKETYVDWFTGCLAALSLGAIQAMNAFAFWMYKNTDEDPESCFFGIVCFFLMMECWLSYSRARKMRDGEQSGASA